MNITIYHRILGDILLLTTCTSLIINSVLFFVKINITPYNFPISYIGGVILTFILWKKYNLSKKQMLSLFTTSTIIITICCTICCYIYDYSYDGQWYHSKSIFYLTHGWNPIYENCPSKDNIGQIWVNHYPKGIESIAASIAKTFKNIEAGKGLNLILIISTLCYTFSFFSNYLSNTSVKKNTFYSIIVTFSPVVLCQFLTFYIDWLLYVLIIILFTTLYRIDQKNEISRQDSFVIACITILALSTKFTYIFWVFIIMTIYAINCTRRKEYKLIITGYKIVFVSSIIGLFITSFNPYITNIIKGYHLLHPLMGEEKIDIMTHNTPDILNTNNRLSAVLTSIFTRPNHGLSETQPTFFIDDSLYSTIILWLNILSVIFILSFKKIQEAVLKNKTFLVACLLMIGVGFFYLIANNANLYGFYRNFLNSSIVDCRLGGFGSFFIESIILSLGITLSIYNYNKRDFFKLLISQSILFISLILLPSGWWARYVPFFYLFICVPLFYLEKNKVYWNLKITLALLITINILFTSYFVIKTSIQYTKKENYYLNLLKEKQPVGIRIGTNQGFYFKLIEKEIKIYTSDTASYELDLFPPVFIDYSSN